MNTSYLNKVIGKPEVTTLVMKTQFPKIRRPMHCIHCGNILQFSYKTVTMITQGASAPEAIQDEIQCRNCRAVFEIC